MLGCAGMDHNDGGGVQLHNLNNLHPRLSHYWTRRGLSHADYGEDIEVQGI
jgi:hypothetical protein